MRSEQPRWSITTERWSRSSAVALAIALSLPSPVPAADPSPGASYVHRGTICELRAASTSIVVLTSVGTAVRRVVIRTGPSTRIVQGVRSLTWNDLARGTVVRAECLVEHGSLFADRIDVVPSP